MGPREEGRGKKWQRKERREGAKEEAAEKGEKGEKEGRQAGTGIGHSAMALGLRVSHRFNSMSLQCVA